MRAFTLIEIIFTILIAGVLSAIAIPKFINFQQNITVSNIIRTSFEVIKEAIEAAQNRKYVKKQQFYKDFNLSDIVSLKSKHWKKATNNCYFYQISNTNSKNVIKIAMDSKEINLTVYCYNFCDYAMQKKCKSLIGAKRGLISLNKVYFY
jgi:prepilin-type N-terminal cleavage/methylation domain-containing protein